MFNLFNNGETMKDMNLCVTHTFIFMYCGHTFAFHNSLVQVHHFKLNLLIVVTCGPRGA